MYVMDGACSLDSGEGCLKTGFPSIFEMWRILEFENQGTVFNHQSQEEEITITFGKIRMTPVLFLRVFSDWLAYQGGLKYHPFL